MISVIVLCVITHQAWIVRSYMISVTVLCMITHQAWIVVI